MGTTGLKNNQCKFFCNKFTNHICLQDVGLFSTRDTLDPSSPGISNHPREVEVDVASDYPKPLPNYPDR